VRPDGDGDHERAGGATVVSLVDGTHPPEADDPEQPGIHEHAVVLQIGARRWKERHG
jgi:hypothetical protein